VWSPRVIMQTISKKTHNLQYIDFGLRTDSFSGTIHLISPLEVETISTNNGGAGNYGFFFNAGVGTIAIVDNEGTVIETIQEAVRRTRGRGG